MKTKNKRTYPKAKNAQVRTQEKAAVKTVEETSNKKINEEEISKDFMIQKLMKEKEDLEQEFTEILEFILGDMKKQEEFIANSMNEADSSNETVAYYKSQYAEAMRKISELEEQNKKLQKRIYSLENSTLGKITVKYWNMRKSKST